MAGPRQLKKDSKSESKTTTASSITKDFAEAFNLSIDSYFKQVNSNNKLKLIDIFAFFLVLIALIQFVFVCLIRDNFPFNAFLAGFIICVGQFILLMCLRMQLLSPFEGISTNRAFGEFVLASLLLHFICLHFIN
ncbi:hypothetical protein KAFR_0D02030 [Kazachstania africana CBS 2517]|uniref:Dolichyl-diphosphooligosaccharide--protein glycosyltransferase subunit OST2 n=1 Tax=Kazachstania africana (strain ATCC 22294 / BCRC 22015 / CBS 2517 / CECT 1963 / NBRC 1671 / NRRL Y-8276) TaxID=1071382 RepID=H2AU00_KAZAF|nr:hypothetical protein KAFR_0D02030 [Kazachstania africana CBS 2517]CCF57850.1 hypothetical protein KAFR_0D02030 [Kazachstania africana CBS 2517]